MEICNLTGSHARYVGTAASTSEYPRFKSQPGDQSSVMVFIRHFEYYLIVKQIFDRVNIEELLTNLQGVAPEDSNMLNYFPLIP